MKFSDRIATLAMIVMLAGLMLIGLTAGAPTGATVQNISHVTKGTTNPQNRTDGKGTINTVNLTSVQQNLKWKAYVGNVSSTFVLDDNADYTIYQWSITNFTGEVYVSRAGSVSWGTIVAATIANKQSEDTALDHTSSSPDSINQTFVTRIHPAFDVGTTPIVANSSYTVVTNKNDAAQVHNLNADFFEMLLHDGTNLVYTTLVENNRPGYRTGRNYDFQMILAENATASAANVRYFFYIELQS